LGNRFFKYQEILKNAGMKITPQRLAVMDIIFDNNNHYSAEEISTQVRKTHSNIAVGTIYNILDILVQSGIIQRVKTEKGSMLYDSVQEKHHHLYCSETDRIEDYYDAELDELIEDYFKRNKINGFKVKDIKLQIVGKFLE